MVVYDSGLVAGQAVCWIDGAVSCALQDPASAGGLADFAGVLNESISASTALATGTLVFGDVTINPDAIYLAQYDSAAANDISVVSSTSTATTLGTCDDNLDGGWLYCNSGTGIGQLGFIGAASTTVMTLDTTTAWTTTPDSTTDVILIRSPFGHNDGAGKDLDSTFTLLATDEDETGEITILENYIESAAVPMGPLRPRQHHMLQNLNSQGVRFYSDIHFADNIFQGLTTWT